MGIQRLRIAHTFTILLARPMCENLKAGQAGVRSFIITFNVYVNLNIFEKYDDNRPAPYARFFLKNEQLKYQI